MRDPARIEKTLAAIGAIWRAYPDLRLTQLILNVTLDGGYYMEDDELIERLHKVYGGLAER